MPLTPEQVKLIKATVPILKAHGLTITTRFYNNMLAEHTELREIFNTTNQANGHQPKALAMAVLAYAEHIDDLGALTPAVELICHKHASLYIRPEHYDIVGKHLLAAMGEVLGEGLTPEILDAWAAAYGQLAAIMIGRERQLMDDAKGWTDWKEFIVKDKVEESSVITSFYLVPKDGKPLPSFKPGQYISIMTDVPHLAHKQARQYSLSEAPRTDYYRISVKREDGLVMDDPKAPAHPGYISNVLHKSKNVGDTLLVSHPFGDFFFEASAQAQDVPVVFISAGVGLTCLLSIFNSLTAEKTSRPISWIHAARTTQHRAFRRHAVDRAADRDNVRTVFFVSEATDADEQGETYHHQGRLDLAKLDRREDLQLDDKRPLYYVCGPEQFMIDMREGLRKLSIPDERIHLELFGTGGVAASSS